MSDDELEVKIKLVRQLLGKSTIFTSYPIWEDDKERFSVEHQVESLLASIDTEGEVDPEERLAWIAREAFYRFRYTHDQ